MVIAFLPVLPELELQVVTYRAPCPHLGTVATFFLLGLPSRLVAWEQTSGRQYLLGILLGGYDQLCPSSAVHTLSPDTKEHSCPEEEWR